MALTPISFILDSMKYLAYAFIIIAFFFVAITVGAQTAVRVFTSEQVGTNPVNGYCLTTNGATSTWAPCTTGGSGTPGGGNLQLQFNNSGVFGGTSTPSVTAINATSTTATSTLANIISRAIQSLTSAGLTFFSNSGTPVADFGAGGGSNASFFGGVNINGQTRIATNLTGILRADSGIISTTTVTTPVYLASSSPSFGLNQLTYVTGAGTIAGTSSPVVGSITATSSTASTFVGSVGIGTTTPPNPLTVFSTNGFAPTVLFENTGLGVGTEVLLTLRTPLTTGLTTGRIMQTIVPGESFGRQIWYSDGSFCVGPGSATRDVCLQRSATNTFAIDNNKAGGSANLTVSNRIGIATTSPVRPLSVNGSSLFTGELALDGSLANIALGNNYLSGDGGDEGVFVGSTGNVAIGSSTAAANFAIQAPVQAATAPVFSISSSTGYDLWTVLGNRQININNQRGIISDPARFNWFFGDCGTLTATGNFNTCLGRNALNSIAGGAANMAVGLGALNSNTSGIENVAIGVNTIASNVSGGNNVAIGDNAGVGVASNSFSNNTLLGAKAGRVLTTGSNNIFIGFNAASTTSSGSNNICIGVQCFFTSNTASNQLNIGNFLYGTNLGSVSPFFGIGTTTPSALLTVAGDMRLTGRFADASSSTGSVGQVLMATATGTQWVSTSTLGFVAGGGSGGVFLASSSPWTTGNLAFVTGNGTVGSTPTTTLVAGTNVSFSGGTPVIIGSAPVTINATGGGGGSTNWTDNGTFLTPLTATDGLLVTGSSTFSRLQFDNATTTGSLWLGNNRLWQHPAQFLDIQRTGSDFTLARIRAPRGSSREATLALVVDLSTTDSGVSEEFVDFYNERYGDSLQWGLRQAYSGTGIAKPFVLGHWDTTGSKDAGNKFIVMPHGTVAVARATSTIPLTTAFFVASSTAPNLVRFDAAPGTSRFVVENDGDTGIATSTPSARFSVVGAAAQTIANFFTSAGSLVMSITDTLVSVFGDMKVTGNLTVEGTVNLPATYRNYVEYFNDFMDETSNAGDAIWGEDISGTGAACTATAIGTNFANRPGMSRCTTGTTFNGRAGLVTSLNSIALGQGTTTFETAVEITTLSVLAQRYVLQAGFFDTNSTSTTDGAYILYDEGGNTSGSAASANWQCVTASNNARTFTTSSVAVTASTVHRLTTVVNRAGNEVKFYVNGTEICTHTTNIPTGTTRATSHGFQVLKALGTTARTFDVDYNYARIDFTTPR